MSGTPSHMHAGRVGVADPAQLAGAGTAPGLLATARVGVVGPAVLASALHLLNGGASIPGASSSQAGRLDP